MQPVNDDMDNLFRQAAESYPLNTQGADFDKLLQRMDATGGEALPKKENRRRYSWLLLLLLLPLPFVCRHYSASGVEDELSITQQQFAKHTNQPTTFSNTRAYTPDNSPAAANEKTPPANIPANTYSNVAPDSIKQADSFGNNTLPAQQNRKYNDRFFEKNSIPPINETDIFTVQDAKKSSGVNRLLTRYRKGKESNGYPATEIADTSGSARLAKTGTKFRSFNENEFASGIALPAESRQPDSIVQADSTKHSTSKPNDMVSAAIARKPAVKDSTGKDSAVVVKTKKEAGKRLKPFFYAGVIAGVDYSVVKSSRTAGTGYNTGLTAGYRFGRHWAVEVGLLWAYKKYRTEGQYIDTAGLGLAVHTQVFNAKGSCSILEIPLTVQYHFNSKNKGHWYAVAGLSSYLIKKEDYYYVGKRYNMVYYAEKEYINSANNWFSMLQLGGGYQLQLGKRSSLRAETYMKLHLSNIGIASLPLSSAGINIGYTRSL